MSSDQQSDVPGGYFVGRPSNHGADKTEEPPHAAADKTEEPPHAAAGEQNPATAQDTKPQSTPSFFAKCCPCLAGGGAAE